MKTIYDRAGQASILATPDLGPRLRDLLQRRFASLVTVDGDLTDWTEHLIVEAGDREPDIVREIGFSPLTDPFGGTRYDQPDFHSYWDWLQRHDGWFEMIVTFGSTFAYVLLIEDHPDADPDLLALCRKYAA